MTEPPFFRGLFWGTFLGTFLGDFLGTIFWGLFGVSELGPPPWPHVLAPDNITRGWFVPHPLWNQRTLQIFSAGGGDAFLAFSFVISSHFLREIEPPRRLRGGLGVHFGSIFGPFSSPAGGGATNLGEAQHEPRPTILEKNLYAYTPSPR